MASAEPYASYPHFAPEDNHVSTPLQLTRIFMIMLAAVVARNVDALKTLSTSSAGSAMSGFSSAASLIDAGSSAIFLQNSASHHIIHTRVSWLEPQQ